MPSVFISYRRADTADAAGRLAADLIERFGRSRVFIDVDSIPLATKFEDRIQAALESCQVVLVLIGDQWLAAKLPSGGRRLDDARDYVRQEVSAALKRDDVTVVPVLVEGAKMPSREELPPEISALSQINAVDLSYKRWRADVRALCGIAQQYDPWWLRAITWLRARVLLSLLIVVLVGAVVAVAIVASSQSGPAPRRQPANGGAASGQPNPEAFAALLRQGPFSETLPDGLQATGLGEASVGDSSASGNLKAVEVKISTRNAPGIGASAHFEVYPTPADATARANARIALLKRVFGADAVQGDSASYCSDGTIHGPTAWECGGASGLVYAEATVYPSSNANQPLATGTTSAILRYADEKARVANG
jgi:TIR domain